MMLDLAIIGGGPAGLSAAIEAKRLGIDRLVVIERESEAGGAPRHCGHSGFGMLDLHRLLTGPRYAEALRARAAEVPLRLDTAVTALHPGGRLTLAGPEGASEITARRVLLATGIRETPRSARLVSGGRPFGIFTTGALQRFIYLEKRLPCRRPVIIGSELVSFSTHLTLRHGGVKPVAFLEENDRFTAPFAALGAKLAFGADLRRNVTDLAIHGTRRVEGVSFIENGSPETLACDAVIFTGRWRPEAALLFGHGAGIHAKTRGPVIDASFRTIDPQLFAAGNVLYAVRSSGPVALEGRRAARAIVEDLRKERP
jgi:thioredoxin reductase